PRRQAGGGARLAGPRGGDQEEDLRQDGRAAVAGQAERRAGQGTAAVPRRDRLPDAGQRGGQEARAGAEGGVAEEGAGSAAPGAGQVRQSGVAANLNLLYPVISEPRRRRGSEEWTPP